MNKNKRTAKAKRQYKKAIKQKNIKRIAYFEYYLLNRW